jgi:hypothetical protein
MKFMLMMNAPRGAGDYQINSWTPDELQAHMAFMHRLNKELMEAGERVLAEGLASPGQAKLVKAAKKGGPPVTDGVFPEAKEFLAGFWIVDVENAERAYEIAAKASLAPGPGGAPLFIPIEVRQVLSAPPRD